MAYTRTWNAAYEASPADADNVSEGAGKIRQLRTDIRERLAKDHYFNIAGTDADHGEHSKVTLRKQGAAPTAEANKGYLYSGDDGAGNTILYYTDDDDDATWVAGGTWVGTSTAKLNTDGSITGVSLALSGAISAVTNVTASGTVTVTTAVATNTISERTAASGVTIDGLVIKDSAITNAGVITNANLAGSITATKLVSYTAGNSVIFTTNFVTSKTWSTSWTTVAEVYFPHAGTVTTRMVVKTDTAVEFYARIYKNGVAEGTQQSDTTTAQKAYGENITVAAGDRLAMKVKSAAGTPDARCNLQIGVYNPEIPCSYNFQTINDAVA